MMQRFLIIDSNNLPFTTKQIHNVYQLFLLAKSQLINNYYARVLNASLKVSAWLVLRTYICCIFL